MGDYKLKIGTNMDAGEDLELDPVVLRNHGIVFGGKPESSNTCIKVIVEELSIAGIPSVIVDTSGGYSGLRDGDLPDVRILTPGSDKGIPVSLSPFSNMTEGLDKPTRHKFNEAISHGLSDLMGYSIKDRESVKPFIATLLSAYQREKEPGTLAKLAESVLKPVNILNASETKKVEGLLDKEKRKKLSQKLKGLEKHHLFSGGVVLEEALFADSGKTPVCVVSLGHIEDRKELEFGTLMTLRALGQWASGEGTSDMFVFISPCKKLLSNPNTHILELLQWIMGHKGDRRISAFLDTDSIADVPRKNRIMTKNFYISRIDLKKDKDILLKEVFKSTDADTAEFVDLLVDLDDSNFMMVCPKYSDEPLEMKPRDSKFGNPGMDEISKLITKDERELTFKKKTNKTKGDGKMSKDKKTADKNAAVERKLWLRHKEDELTYDWMKSFAYFLTIIWLIVVAAGSYMEGSEIFIPLDPVSQILAWFVILLPLGQLGNRFIMDKLYPVKEPEPDDGEVSEETLAYVKKIKAAEEEAREKKQKGLWTLMGLVLTVWFGYLSVQIGLNSDQVSETVINVNILAFIVNLLLLLSSWSALLFVRGREISSADILRILKTLMFYSITALLGIIWLGFVFGIIEGHVIFSTAALVAFGIYVLIMLSQYVAKIKMVVWSAKYDRETKEKMNE